MIKYKYYKADAFTSGDSLGNPAACIFTGNDVLTDEQMLKIGKEHKGFVCELVFVRNSKDADCYMTYYSSECEVSFCGHGTIATMYTYLKQNPDIAQKDILYIETHLKGIIEVHNHIKDEDAVYVSAPKALYLDLPIDKQIIADRLCIPIESISENFPIRAIEAGNKCLVVPLSDFSTEINAFPDEEKLKEFCLTNGLDVIIIFTLETEDKTHFAHTRVFCPKFGYLEDPATGSANSAFANYLLENKMWDGSPISIEQGGKDRIFNVVKLATYNDKILFGGKATLKIEGDYMI